MKVKISELEEITTRALKKYGYNDEEISIIREILMYAQLRGNNQGLVKLIGKGIPKDPEAGEIKVIRETKLSALLDGSKNFGMIVMKKATDMAVAKAKEHGFGIVGNNNTYSSTGAIGYYTATIAKQGLIGFAFAGSPPTVAPYGSSEALFGTNPLAIGVPSDLEPVVLDMATAAIPWFGLIEAKTAGRQITHDIAYDEQGAITTDPEQAMKGAVKAFGGHKGSGLAFMITVLTGPLVGASFAGIGDRDDWGNLVIAIDPALLIDPQEFRANVKKLIEKVKQTKKLPGVKEIFVPGERGNKLTNERLTLGEIEVEDNLLNELKKVTEEQ